MSDEKRIIIGLSLCVVVILITLVTMIFDDSSDDYFCTEPGKVVVSTATGWICETPAIKKG